jgi:replication initiation and membrane attachment protein DnaB
VKTQTTGLRMQSSKSLFLGLCPHRPKQQITTMVCEDTDHGKKIKTQNNMTTIKNIQPLSAEEIYDLLKKDFAAYADSKIDSNLTIEFAHVYDEINISFPEVKEGVAFNLTISDEEIIVGKNDEDFDFDLNLLREQLVNFLKEKCE